MAYLIDKLLKWIVIIVLVSLTQTARQPETGGRGLPAWFDCTQKVIRLWIDSPAGSEAIVDSGKFSVGVRCPTKPKHREFWVVGSCEEFYFTNRRKEAGQEYYLLWWPGTNILTISYDLKLSLSANIRGKISVPSLTDKPNDPQHSST